MTGIAKVDDGQSYDARFEAIKNWVRSELKIENFEIEVASADASFRRYFRLISGEKRWVIMDAPPDKEDCQSFIRIAKLIESADVQAPHIFSFNEPRGFMLLSDLGSTAYLDELNNFSSNGNFSVNSIINSRANDLYFDAIQSIVKMQTIKTDMPAYDEKLLQFEMSLFVDWFIARHLNIKLDKSQADIIQRTFRFLCESALQQSAVFVHRDYHSRNLMVTPQHSPGVIDFQDAVNGPPTYDLVSLIKDCYIAWPREMQLHWIEQFLNLSPMNIDQQTFIKQLDLMGMQRHLKAIGIFARLNYRDAKAVYLNDIPRTLAYVVDVCQRYEELTDFSALLSSLKITADSKTLEIIK